MDLLLLLAVEVEPGGGCGGGMELPLPGLPPRAFLLVGLLLLNYWNLLLFLLDVHCRMELVGSPAPDPLPPPPEPSGGPPPEVLGRILRGVHGIGQVPGLAAELLLCLDGGGGGGGGISRDGTGMIPGGAPKHGGFALPNLTPPDAHTVLA